MEGKGERPHPEGALVGCYSVKDFLSSVELREAKMCFFSSLFPENK